MRSKSQVFELLERVLSFSDADESEVLYFDGEDALTRFAENRIHQNVSEKNWHLLIRVYVGKKVGATNTNKIDEDSLKWAIRTAINQAKLQEDDQNYVPLPGPQRYQGMDSVYFKETVDFDPENRARTVIDVLDQAKAENLVASGIFSTGFGIRAQANSKGLKAFHQASAATFSTTITSKQHSTGWAWDEVFNVTDLETATIAERAIQKAKKGIDAASLELGKYTVILEPQAVVDMIQFLAILGFGGLRFLEGRSFMSGKIGEKITGENITILDDVFNPMSDSAPFDFEGIPKKRVTLIENGVAKGVVHDLSTAKKVGIESTGHGIPKPNMMGPLPLNIVILGGNSTLEEMIASTEKGILITHFHYNRIVDPIKTTLTGLTRDGTFLIEKGKVTTGIKNMRYNQNILEALSNVEMMSEPVRCENGIIAPAMKINEFNFSAVAGS